MRLKLIACEVMYRELCWTLARSPHQVDAEFLPKGLHDLGATPMLERLQAVVDAVDESRYDGILLGYALCGNGVVGLRARQIPLVIPRAHDCIALFLGSRERYQEYFDSHPGAYFATTGWLERGADPESAGQLSIQSRTGMTSSFEELKQRFGEDNARYVWDQLCNYTRNYRQVTFIEMGLEPDGRFELLARKQAEQRLWDFEKEQGDLGLIRRLVEGEWPAADFLIVPPGHMIRPTYDDTIVGAVPAKVE